MTKPTVIPESLETEIDHTIEESRMVLPGIQALFGFQLIAVFNERFSTVLEPFAQYLHLSALALVAVSIGLIMAPAAYHRQAERNVLSRFFADYASRIITVAMAPLSVAISIDVALVTLVITRSVLVSTILGGLLLGFFSTLWFFIPRAAQRQRTAHKRYRRV
jgi:hypothetical protein